MSWRVAALAGSLLFVGAAPASATTYCAAPATGCGGGDLPTIQAALNAAAATPSADDVRLGAKQYLVGPDGGPWTYNDPFGTNPVTVRGTGQLDSRLASLTGGPTLSLINGSADNILVTGPPSGVGVSLTAGTLSNSQVVVTTNGRGVDAASAAVDHSSIVPAGGSTGNTAVRADQSTIVDTSMSTTNGVDVVNAPVAVRRATIVTKGFGLQSGLPSTTISDSQIVLNDPTAVGVEGVCFDAVGTITVDAQNLTITGVAGGGISFRSTGGGVPGLQCGGHIAVSSSLVQGVSKTADCAPGIGSASVAIRYSDADLSPTKVTGNCTGAVNAGNNFFADPKLATPATLQPVPRFDSPLVDAGDPAAPGAGQPTDIAGLPRAVNGRRDIGAFEYGRRAPALSLASSPATVQPAEPVSFTATTSDPDLGDTVTVGWSFDDGATATGAQVTHGFAAGGTHTATATATDSAGVRTVRTVTVAVAQPGEDITPFKQDTPSPVKLVLDQLAIAPARFPALGSGPGLTTAAAPRGATLSYRVTDAAMIRLTAERLLPGRRVGARCVKPSRKNRRGRACTRVVPVAGSLTDSAPAAGTRKVGFTGRIGGRRLAIGSYTLNAQATSGTQSSAATPVQFRIVAR